MKKIAILVLCAAAFAAHGQKKNAWPNEPKAVFGVELGAPLPNDRIADCGGVKVEAEKSLISVCAMRKPGYGDIPISGLPVAEFDDGYISRTDDTDVVTSILLTGRHADYRGIKALLIERYGKPNQATTEKLQNRMGATFTSEVLSWTGRRVSLVLRERSGTIDQTSAFFSHNEWLDKRGADREKATRESASKM